MLQQHVAGSNPTQQACGGSRKLGRDQGICGTPSLTTQLCSTVNPLAGRGSRTMHHTAHQARIRGSGTTSSSYSALSTRGTSRTCGGVVQGGEAWVGEWKVHSR